MVVVNEDEAVIAHGSADRLQEDWIGLLPVVDGVPDDPSPALAVRHVTEDGLGDMEEVGDELGDGLFPEIGVADVQEVFREDDPGLIAEFQDVNRKTFHD